MAIRKIHLIGERNRKEYLATATVKPGHLVARDATGNIAPHAVAGGRALCIVANENYLQGKTVDDAYANGDLVECDMPDKGDTYAFILKTGYAYTPATPLVSAGDGRLQPLTALASASQAAAFVFGYPDEVVTLTGSGAVDTLGAVNIL